MTSIDALREAGAADWTNELVLEADAAGNHDGKITVAELDRYLNASADGLGALPSTPQGLQLPATAGVNVRSRASAQGIAVLRSRIADKTGEGDLLRARGPGLQLLHDYSRTVYDSEHRIPLVVAYALSASDLVEQPARSNSFFADTALPEEARGSNADYVGSGFDKGHTQPAEDTPNPEAMLEAGLLSTKIPQAPNLNRKGWRFLELAIRDAVQASGGEAVIFTGGLFLDANDKPLPESQKQWIGKDGAHHQAVPTHCFKAALIRTPDGHLTMIGFVIPNRDDLPGTMQAFAPVLDASRRSVADIERLAGETFFDDLPDSIERPLEAQTNACLGPPRGTKIHAASLLYSPGCSTQSFTMPSGTGLGRADGSPSRSTGTGLPGSPLPDAKPGVTTRFSNYIGSWMEYLGWK